MRRHLAPHAVVLRSRMILMLAEALGPAVIGRQLGVCDRVVRKWRARWEKAPEPQGLYDASRPGWLPSISLPPGAARLRSTTRRARRPILTYRALFGALYAQTGVRISRSSIQRILGSRGLRPHRIRYWLHSPDPEFATKVRRSPWRRPRICMSFSSMQTTTASLGGRQQSSVSTSADARTRPRLLAIDDARERR